jgi:hypothetical protein
MLPPTKKKKINPLLLKVIFISVAIHLLAGLILGSITIYKYVVPSEAQFEEPPVVEQEEPPPPVKVQIRPQQPKQQQAQNLAMRPVANIAVANVDVNLPNMEQNFTVSTGLGSMGGGSLLGGTRGSIGMGLSDVSVFGLKSRAERILFVIDANRQMVTDKKGGLNSYKIIKDEITDMVGNLSAGTLFNVMLQDRTKMMLFKPQLVSAGSEVHQQLIQWINPINADSTKVGLEGNRLAKKPQLQTLPDEEVHKILPHGHRGNETCFITQVALEQNVDAIFFITGYHRGFETVIKPASERMKEEWQRKIAKPDYIKQLAAHKLEVPQMQARIKATMAKIDADRKKKGQPPRVLNQRHGVYSNANELGLKWKTNHPGHGPGHQQVKDRDVSKYFRNLIDELYEDHDKPVPSVNVVLFLAGDEAFDKNSKTLLDKYVRFFRGKNRVIRGLNEISSARSSKKTKN